MKRIFHVAKYLVLLVVIIFSEKVEGQNINQKYQTYVSTVHNFSFEYPQSFSLKEYYPESVSLSGSKDFWINLDVIDVENWCKEKLEFEPGIKIDSDKLRAAALDQAMLSNSADGPDGSFYSNNPKVEKDYFSGNGLRTFRFYLDGIYEDYEAGTKTVNPIGPFYGIDISAGRKKLVLLIAISAEKLADKNQMLVIEKIADSVKLTNK